jgi:hypothetical protein
MSKIQRQDIKTETDLTNAGAPISSLPGDDQVYVAANSINKTLRQAIIDGDIGGGAGGINYITNGSVFENLNGWATYADAAQSRPVDGTGGSPSVTIVTSNNNPLSGNRSLIITKPSANLQGQGVSYNFTIDNAAKARVLKIEFDYIVNSGTFNAGSNTADSDLIVYIYDVDANQVIEPSTFKLYANATNIADKFGGYFQTSADSTNYRLIFHVATTNSSSWSLKVDNVVVSPSKYVYGTPITDWQSYTPTVNGLGTGSGTATGLYRRVGGNVEIKFRFVKDSSNGSGSSVVRFSLPAGIAVDTSRLTIASSNVNACGYANSNGIEGTPNNFVTSAVLHAGYAGFPNEFTISNPGAGGNAEYVGSDFRANSTLDGFATFPVQGWSSSVKMSDGYEGREILVGLIGGSAAGNNNVSQKITGMTLASYSKDTTASWDAANSRFIVPVSGFYSIVAQGYFVNAGGANNGVNAILLHKNGSYLTDVARRDSIATENQSTWSFASGSTAPVYLVAGDTLEFYAFQNSGVTRTFNGYVFAISRISSPQTIGMNEVVAARYTSTAGQSIPNNTGAIINFETKDYDTHNAVTTGTNWIFTAPVAGVYNLSSHVLYDQFSVGGTAFLTLYVIKNGSFFADINRNVFSTYANTFYNVVNGSIDIKLNAGDTISVVTYNGTGANRNLYNASGYVWVAIHKV